MADIGKVGAFDRFASWISMQTSRAYFFALCMLLVIVWFPTLFLMGVDTSQLIINTATTIITFLLVALLQNSAARADGAIQAKLNVVAEGLRDLMDHLAHETCSIEGCDFTEDIRKLEIAIGLEDQVGTIREDDHEMDLLTEVSNEP